ncbi:cytochrome P450 [Micromonospora sp. WMMD956]|jgi:cytochrome P450|uniref:cytochrome P450 n=1 Tax=Micromonospora sp. WMMD956 TaxID=3016108 RepID=UPI0024165E9E|nr:cytochrome P450 [Micromonospora sp. WMMD956]MDG4818808.1 cytochrome P450 [Micromonospora sp. WMMD956]
MPAVATGASPTRLLARPYWFRSLPAGADVHRLDEGLFAVTGNAAVQEALAHPEIVAEHPLKASARAFGPNVLDADGPSHRAFRALLAPILSAGRIAEYKRSLMPGLVRELVGSLTGVETDDFYNAFAHRVPYGIVCTILGIDVSLADRFHELTRPLARLLDYPTEETEETHANVAELLRLIEEQRAAGAVGGQSLLETIERTRDRKGILLTDSEVRSTALLFFLAGTETSSAFITSLVYCMGRGVFDLDELRDDRVRDDYVEEVLRLYPPVQTVVRFASADLTLRGVEVPRHSAVLTSIAGANRDPRVFDHPDRFQLGRSTKGSVPFAVGAHACPGAMLAKTEFSLLIEEIIERCSDVVITRDRLGMESQSFSRPTNFSVEFRAR